MKKLTYISLAVAILSIFAQSQSWAQKKSSSSSMSISRNNDNGRGSGSMTMINDGVSIKMEYEGKITFNEEETAVKSLSPNGYLKYKKNDKKLVIESNSKGEVSYEFYDDGEKLAFDERGKKFLAEAIKDMVSYGTDAEGRVERIYKKGGAAAVLKEVGNMQSDHVKSIYFEYLLTNHQLSSSEMTEIAQKVGTAIDSDFEKGKLLGKFSGDYLKNTATAKAYLDAVISINSDFEKANALKNILKQSLNDEQFTQVFSAANTINSDFEKANVLKSVLKNNKISPQQFSEVLKTIASINSDFEKANVLKSVLSDNTLSSSQFSETLSVINDINSDFERANVLKQLIEKGVFAGEGFDKLLGLISDMGSDFERANVLKRLIEKDIKTDEQWIALINITADMSSDFEKSNVLIKIGRTMPKSEKVKII